MAIFRIPYSGQGQDESEIANVTEKKSRKSQKTSCVVLTICFVASITFFVTIFIVPIFFKDFYVLDQLFCTDGYFDKDTSSARLFDCSGEFFMIKFEFSKKATKIDEIFTINLMVTTYCHCINGEDFVNFWGLLIKCEL